jgi:hypothetical protein
MMHRCASAWQTSLRADGGAALSRVRLCGALEARDAHDARRCAMGIRTHARVAGA